MKRVPDEALERMRTIMRAMGEVRLIVHWLDLKASRRRVVAYDLNGCTTLAPRRLAAHVAGALIDSYPWPAKDMPPESLIVWGGRP